MHLITEIIHRNLEYVCKEGGHCIVDVSRRNQCQACRFSKCLKANMRREGKEKLSLILFKHFNHININIRYQAYYFS